IFRRQLRKRIATANRVEGSIGLEVVAPERPALVASNVAQRPADQLHRALLVGGAVVPVSAVWLPRIARHSSCSLSVDTGHVIEMSFVLLSVEQRFFGVGDGLLEMAGPYVSVAAAG